ncbi:MAG: GAF and ANTAR domain-containing protein [Nitriliruptoraceae bacterium]
MTTSRPDRTTTREHRLVTTFIELADTLVEDFDVVEFLSLLTERVVELGIATQAGILLADETGSLRFMAASNEQTELLELFQVQSREGPCQDCYRTGIPVSVAHLEDERERWPRFVPQALTTGFAAVHAVPLRLRDTVLGALNLFTDQPGAIDPDSLAVVQAMADVATIGLVQQRELHRAHTVEAQLQHALHSRIAIEQSKGILFEQAGVSMSDAFEMLRTYARNSNTKLSDTARFVVEGTLTAEDLSVTR